MNVVLPAPDPLIGLPPDLHAELRALLEPIAAAGLPLERNPSAPSLVATRIEGRMFQVGLIYAEGEPSRVVILGPAPLDSAFVGNPNAMSATEWERDVFLALLPPPPDAPPEPAPSLGAFAMPEDDTRSLLREIRDHLAAIRSALPFA